MRAFTTRLRTTAALAVAALGALPAAAAAEPLLAYEAAFGAPHGRFADPAGIAADAGGRVYVADAGAGRVEVFDSASDGNGHLGTIGAGEVVPPARGAVRNPGPGSGPAPGRGALLP